VETPLQWRLEGPCTTMKTSPLAPSGTEQRPTCMQHSGLPIMCHVPPPTPADVPRTTRVIPPSGSPRVGAARPRFSIIMLNTDAHSPSVEQKMCREDFIRPRDPSPQPTHH